MKKGINKKELVERAKKGDKEAELKLLEINQLGILEEAKNPDTSEEIAIEMLAELSLSPLVAIRKKAISLLTKLVPEKIKEKLMEESVSLDVKENILATVLEIAHYDIYLYFKIFDSKDFPPALKEKIVQKINLIRKEVEKNATEIMQLHYQVDEIETLKREKFKIINNLYSNFKTFNNENLKNNKVFYDFKMDVELSYQSLKNTIKLE